MSYPAGKCPGSLDVSFANRDFHILFFLFPPCELLMDVKTITWHISCIGLDRKMNLAILQFLTAFFIALIISLIFAIGLRGKRLWLNFLFFFSIFFLITWAGGIWLTPFGPSIKGFYLVPFLVVGVLIALFLAAAVTSYKPRSKKERSQQGEVMKLDPEAVFGSFFWALIILLFLAVVSKYAW